MAELAFVDSLGRLGSGDETGLAVTAAVKLDLLSDIHNLHGLDIDIYLH